MPTNPGCFNRQLLTTAKHQQNARKAMFISFWDEMTRFKKE
jgi:hypothetical protein